MLKENTSALTLKKINYPDLEVRVYCDMSYDNRTICVVINKQRLQALGKMLYSLPTSKSYATS